MSRSNRAVRCASRAAVLAFSTAMATFAAAAPPLSHAPDLLLHDGFEGVTAGPFNDSDAARFLSQATFGPTDADIAHLRSLVAANGGAGYQAWLNEQAAATPSSPFVSPHDGERDGSALLFLELGPAGVKLIQFLLCGLHLGMRRQ